MYRILTKTAYGATILLTGIEVYCNDDTGGNIITIVCYDTEMSPGSCITPRFIEVSIDLGNPSVLATTMRDLLKNGYVDLSDYSIIAQD